MIDFNRSTIVAYLERRFEPKNNVKVAYLYCDYKDPDQTGINLIASLLQQIVQSEAELSDGINALYRDHTRRQTRTSLADFSRLLQTGAHRFSRLFVVIDGMDECTDNTRDFLLSTIRKLQPYLNLLITAHSHLSIISDTFKDASLLEICASHEDIKRYIRGRLKKESRLQEYIRKDPKLENRIITRIAGITEGRSVSAFPVCVLDSL
jgi:hypothetical protein